jgi:hypothetical protein
MKAVYQCRGARRVGEWGLFPVDDDGVDLMKGIRGGREVTADIRQPRNPGHHRLYWAIIKFIRMHSPVLAGFPQERIHIALKFAAGHTETMVDIATGKVVHVVKSIMWDEMDQTEFTRFFDDAMQIVTNRWMPPGTTAEAVRQEIMQMVDPYKGGYGG